MFGGPRSATHGEGGGGGGGGGEEAANDDDDDEEEGGGGDGVASWNLRRCSAAGLDMLSTVFGDELLPTILPIVQARLQVSGGVGSRWNAGFVKSSL